MGRLKGRLEALQAAGKKLDSRLKRAADQGWEVDPQKRWHHSSNSKFSRFNLERAGSNTGANTEGYGIYFADTPENTKRFGRHQYELVVPEYFDAHMMDFDAPFSQQPEAAKVLLEEFRYPYPKGHPLYGQEANGAQLYRALAEQLGSQRKASKYLSGHILGAKYNSSMDLRSNVGGRRNYLLWDQDALDDLRSVNAAFDPEKIDSANLLASGAAAAVGLGAASQEAEAGPISKGGKRIIEAWHGSPHKFPAERLIRWADGKMEYLKGAPDRLPDVPAGAEVVEDFPLGRFDKTKVGTGEGAAAYGHGPGGYHADAKGVAKDYRKKLAGQEVKTGSGKYSHQDLYSSLDEDERRALTLSMYHNGDYAAARKEAIGRGEDQAFLDALDFFEKEVEFTGEPAGALYRTHLNVDPDTLLDWDKPLSEQPSLLDSLQRYVDRKAADKGGNVLLTDGYTQSVAEMLKYPDDVKGWDAYSTLADYRQSGDASINQQEATRIFQEAGIPGIRYLDGDSRSAGYGTYNYVMFDDAPVSIQERGAARPDLLAGVAAGGLAADQLISDEQEFPHPSIELQREILGLLDSAISAAPPQRNAALEALGNVTSGLMTVLGDLTSAAEAYQRPVEQAYGLARGMYGLAGAETPEDVQRAASAGVETAKQDQWKTSEELGDWVRGDSNSPMVNMVAEGVKWGAGMVGL